MIWKKPSVEAVLCDTDVEHMDLLGDWAWSAQYGTWSAQGGCPWSGQTGTWRGQS